MSLKTLIISDVANVFLQVDDFAETCQRFVGGDAGNIKTIIGIPGDDMPAIDDVRGRGYTHSRTFDIAETSTLTEADAVQIGAFRYEVVHVSDPMQGMKTAKLARTQQEVKGGRVFRTGDI
jgi:hypothetical protein